MIYMYRLIQNVEMPEHLKVKIMGCWYGWRYVEFIHPMSIRKRLFQRKREEKLVCKDKLFFKNDHYSIYYNHLEDEMYGKPDAYVISPEHIISAQRVTEEFQWRQ